MPLLPLYSETFWEPLTEDVEELLSRFQHLDSVRYEVFAAVWREMNFSDVFLGIPVLNEAKRFCKIAMTTAMKYFLPPYSYKIRVGGLYLMYGFYHMQPSPMPVNIRLALKDWEHVHRFLNESVAAGHLDVVYIFQKLISSKAIHYTAIQHFLTFQKHVNPKKEPMCAEFLGRATKPQELISVELLEELTNVQRHYEGMKAGIRAGRSDVAMIHPDFASRLKDCTLGFIQWQETIFTQHEQKKKSKGNGVKSESGELSRAKLLSSIKQKSYSSFPEMSKSRRHRQAETVDSSSSGVEQQQETRAVKRKRPPTLRARTYQSLSVTSSAWAPQ